jgi:Zn-dependent protease
MRLTGYRNVSVFFLPGLGGLATGEKADATPMEKLLVYLAGPVPGMVLAGAGFWASSAGLWQAPGWLNEFLIASLAINYLNLLPVSPLDGGRVLETFAFARHPRLRFGFAAVCCGLLLVSRYCPG